MAVTAVIDLGTNTCNLLIVDILPNGQTKLIYTGKESVKLGQGGINRKIITPEAMQRGLLAIQRHMQRIREAGCTHIRAIGTSAVRNASNKKDFLDLIKKETGVEIEIIDGDSEAGYIYQGARMAVGFDEKKVLILDIGGGSNEFIIGNKDQIFWRQSFEIGIARIREEFPISEPITQEEIKQIECHFDKHLQPLWKKVKQYPIDTLIGCSGAFDTFVDLIDNLEPESTYRIKTLISLSDFQIIHQRIITSDHTTLEVMKGLDPIRISMIVIASIFVNFVLQKINIKTMFQSGYALKEGVLAEIAGIQSALK